MAEEHESHGVIANRIWQSIKEFQEWSARTFPKGINPDNEDQPVDLTVGLTHLGDNIYRAENNDIFKIIDGRLRLVIDPNEKYND